jgi:hypothetical protein
VATNLNIIKVCSIFTIEWNIPAFGVMTHRHLPEIRQPWRGRRVVKGMGRVRFFVRQLLLFTWTEVRCCLFALAVFAGLALSKVVPLPVARYDVLLVYCVAVTFVFWVFKVESTREILVICGTSSRPGGSSTRPSSARGPC